MIMTDHDDIDADPYTGLMENIDRMYSRGSSMTGISIEKLLKDEMEVLRHDVLHNRELVTRMADEHLELQLKYEELRAEMKHRIDPIEKSIKELRTSEESLGDDLININNTLKKIVKQHNKATTHNIENFGRITTETIRLGSSQKQIKEYIIKQLIIYLRKFSKCNKTSHHLRATFQQVLT